MNASISEASHAFSQTMEFMRELRMDETKTNSDLLVPLGVLVAKCIHLFKASEDAMEDVKLDCTAPKIIPFALRVLN